MARIFLQNTKWEKPAENGVFCWLILFDAGEFAKCSNSHPLFTDKMNPDDRPIVLYKAAFY